MEKMLFKKEVMAMLNFVKNPESKKFSKQLQKEHQRGIRLGEIFDKYGILIIFSGYGYKEWVGFRISWNEGVVLIVILNFIQIRIRYKKNNGLITQEEIDLLQEEGRKNVKKNTL